MDKSKPNTYHESEVRKGPWTMEEDLILINYITTHGEGVWNSLAKAAGLKRTGKSCRLRWLNYLRPDVRRGNITPEEELLIMELHAKWGNRWSKIAKHLPGRTDNEIKNYWRTKIQKHLKHHNNTESSISSRHSSSDHHHHSHHQNEPASSSQISTASTFGGGPTAVVTASEHYPQQPPPYLPAMSSPSASLSYSDHHHYQHHHHNHNQGTNHYMTGVPVQMNIGGASSTVNEYQFWGSTPEEDLWSVQLSSMLS